MATTRRLPGARWGRAAEFDRLHRAYHAWEPSELTALNEAIAAGRQNVPVSHELATPAGRRARCLDAGTASSNPRWDD